MKPKKKAYHEEASTMTEIENELLRSWDNGYNQALDDFNAWLRSEECRELIMKVLAKCDEIEDFESFKKEARKGHFGDCTNEPEPCEKCLWEEWEIRAKAILEGLAKEER